MAQKGRVNISRKEKRASEIYKPDNKIIRNRLQRKDVRIPIGRHFFGRIFMYIRSLFGWRPPRDEVKVKSMIIVPTQKGYHKGCFGKSKYLKSKGESNARISSL